MTWRAAAGPVLVALVALAACGAPWAAGEGSDGTQGARTAYRPSTAVYGARTGTPAPDPPPGTPRPDARPCNRGRARWTRPEVLCLIRRTWPHDTRAVCIAWHESRLNPRAVGRAGERGLFQLHPVHRAWLGSRWAHMFEPPVNVRAAKELTRMRGDDGRPLGWRPWSTAGVCR